MIIIVKLVLQNPSKLRALIKLHGLSLSQFANKIHISNTYLSRIINYRYYPAPETARKIAQGVGKTIPDIFSIKMLTEDNKES